jgi:hypothetical protein
MAMERVAELVRRAAQASGFVEMLGQQPEQLRSVLGLTDAHMAALRSAAALVPRPTFQAGVEDFQAVSSGTATLYPPEGTGTMDTGYVIIPAPSTAPSVLPAAPLPPLAVGPVAPRLAPQPTVPYKTPVPPPGMTPSPIMIPRSPICRQPQLVPMVPPSPPVSGQPGPPQGMPISTPSSQGSTETQSTAETCLEEKQLPTIGTPWFGWSQNRCCDSSILAIVAMVSETTLPAMTAMTTIAGLRR